MRVENLTKDCPRKKTTLRKAEKDNLVQFYKVGSEPIANGHEHKLWPKFTSQMRKGDELWEFCYPPPSGPGIYECEGLCIVRDGEIEDYFVIDCIENYEPEDGIFVNTES